MCKLRKKLFVLMTCASLVTGSVLEPGAYVKNGYKLSNPKKVNFVINPSANIYAGMIPAYTKTWGTYCPEIGFSSDSSPVIYFTAKIDTVTDAYAVTTHHNDDYHSITFYKSFADATEAEKHEVIAHEMGHALGLSHCQKSKNSISVMRDTGFNGKAYPLSDDISGIAAIY